MLRPQGAHSPLEIHRCSQFTKDLIKEMVFSIVFTIIIYYTLQDGQNTGSGQFNLGI